MKIDIPKFLLYVMVMSATALAADSSTSSTLATKVTIEEEKSLLNNDERATPTTTTTTTITTPQGFAASSLSSLSSSSLSSSSSSSLVDANTVVVDRTSENNGDSDGRFSPNSINKLRVVVDPVNRGEGLSSKTGTMHHTETLSVNGGGRFSQGGIINRYAVVDVINDDGGISLPVDSGGRFSSTGMDASAPNDVVNLYLHAVVDAINDNAEISSFTGTGGSDVSAQRKLIKSSKKVKHPEALCTLSLFADSLFIYANQCFTDIMVTISPCDDKDDTCYISERLPSVPQEEQAEQENQEEEQCFVGGSFPAKKNIRYNPSTGDCEFLYVDLTDDPCNSYTGDTGTGSLGLKAWINMQHNPDVMFIQFTKDKGLTFYNAGDERAAKRSKTHNDRYLRQEGATKPMLSMMPHPFASRRLFIYPEVSIKNDTPHEVIFARVDYSCCQSDQNTFIGSGGTWTVETTRGVCLVTEIHSTLIVPDGSSTGRLLECASYLSFGGTGYAEFFLMFHNGECCLRSSDQSNTECTKQSNDDIRYCDPSEKEEGYNYFCGKTGNKMPCANDVWKDGCDACMCFNYGNALWCDGYRGDYYDTYFDQYGKNPWGDRNPANRKCNQLFFSEGADCVKDWQCAYGLSCRGQVDAPYITTCHSGLPDSS